VRQAIGMVDDPVIQVDGLARHRVASLAPMHLCDGQRERPGVVRVGLRLPAGCGGSAHSQGAIEPHPGDRKFAASIDKFDDQGLVFVRRVEQLAPRLVGQNRVGRPFLPGLADMAGFGHLAFGAHADQPAGRGERAQPTLDIGTAAVQRRLPLVEQDRDI